MPCPLLSSSKQLCVESFKWGSKHSFCQGVKISEVKDRGWKKIYQFIRGMGTSVLIWAQSSILFSTSNFDLQYISSPLNEMNVKYLIRKIQYLSIWKKRAKVMVWLFVAISVGQGTPKILHKMQIDPESL